MSLPSRSSPLTFVNYPTLSGRYVLKWVHHDNGALSAVVEFDSVPIIRTDALAAGYKQEQVSALAASLQQKLEMHLRDTMRGIKAGRASESSSSAL